MIDILNIKPHEVSSGIKGYAIGFAGEPGCGKTTTASQAPKPLFLACEAGYKAIPGVMAVDIHSWADVMTVASQLKKPEARERFETIVIDTYDEFVFYAEEYLCATAGVKTLNDIPWGGGHAQLEKMLRKFFKDIVRYYGLIVIGHVAIKQDTDEEETKYATMSVNKKAKKILMGLLDVYGYIEANRDPNKPNIIHFRPSKHWEAKTRFANMEESTIFNYENIEKSIKNAVAGIATTSVHKDYYAEETVQTIDTDSFEALKIAVTELGMSKIDTVGQTKVLSTIDAILGGKKIADCVPADLSLLKVLKEEFERL